MRTRSSLEYTIPRRRNRRRSRSPTEANPLLLIGFDSMAEGPTYGRELRLPTGGSILLIKGTRDCTKTPPSNFFSFHSLDGVAKTWLDKEPPNSILTWDDLVSKFINFFFPPSKTTNLRNEITNFRQIAQESFSEAWERFKELLRKCPHHGFSLMHQLDTFYNSLSYNDQDSLNSAAGGNFLYKSPTEGLQIIENKAKVRCSRNAVMRVSTNAPPSSSTSSSSNFEFQQMAAALEDKMTLTFRNEMNEMKNMMKALVPTPVPIKAVEERCTTCGSNHSYNVCPMTRGGYEYPVYHDNFQQFQQTASVGNFVQNGNSGYRPPNLANQIRPPGFNQQNNNRNVNANQGYNRNKTNGNQVNHGANSGLTQQAQAYQAPSTQVPVTYARFEAYTKANDVTLNNLQKNLNDFKREQQDFQNEQRNFQNMMLNMFQKQMGNNNASGSGTLPSNTIPNPRNEVKAITTRSGLAYDGPLPPMPPPYVNPDNEKAKENEVTKDKVQPESSQSTANVQPRVDHGKGKDKLKDNEKGMNEKEKDDEVRESVFEEILIDKEEFFLPKSPPIKPNKPTKTLPYPSRVEYEKKGENDKVQIQKFWEMFKKIHVNITLADALILMPKYQKMLKSLLSNKEKLNEMANTPVSENCSTIILKKLPEKLEDPRLFLIPCTFSELKCKALADLGASINLMPFSVYTKLGLPALQSTRMTLELANCSLCVPKGIARDVLVPVGRFTFPADFVVVDFECNYRVPLILGRPFLRTARVLIDVHGEELVIRDGMERIVFKLDGSQDKESIHMIDIYDDRFKDVCEPETNDSSSPTSTIVEEFDSLVGEIIKQKEEVKEISDPVARRRACFSKLENFRIIHQGRVIHSPKIAFVGAISHIFPNNNLEDSFKMGDEDLNFIPNKELDKEDLIPIPRESKIGKECDFPPSFTPFEGSEMLLEEEIDEFLKHDESLNMDLNDEFNDEEGDIIYLEKLLENENFFEMNDKKVESLERKTKEDFETKDEPKSKKDLQVVHPDIEILNHFETTSYVGSDYVFYEDFNLMDMIFPMNIQGKIFDPGITFHEKSFEKDAFKDKSSKKLAPFKALDVFDPLHPPLIDFHVTKALSGFTVSLLKIFSKKFFEHGNKNATAIEILMACHKTTGGHHSANYTAVKSLISKILLAPPSIKMLSIGYNCDACQRQGKSLKEMNASE
ncbi:reverse transcriptase domain-containing protein [Tanacetum coccineum]|uniref:Reverse transcriptase domain-containing protein n=1 Tax=Tanacetum coccineum TaxID=301880 RepID=A0ABQ5BRK0_9ASTR